MPRKKLYNTNGIVYSTNLDLNVASRIEEEVTLPVQEQLLTVRMDAKHRGGKTVTLIEGFSGTNSDLEKLGREIKSYCATGGSAKNNEIIIQGDNREKIFQWLVKKGYKKTRKL